jgi:hypothetical protein
LPDPLVPIVLVGVAAVAVDLAMIWFCSRAVGRSPIPGLVLSAIVIVFVGGLITSWVVRDRSTITSITHSPDSFYELETHAEKDLRIDGLIEWTVYARSSAFRLLQRGDYIFYAWNLSRLETRWDDGGELLILCDCSAGIVWEVKARWGATRIRVVEVPSAGSDHLPVRPDSIPEGATRVDGKWIYCQTARAHETWNLCSAYADKTGELITSGRYRLAGTIRAASEAELRYIMYDNTLQREKILLRDDWTLEKMPIEAKPVN